MHPQLADKMLMKEAIERSEAEAMEELLVNEYKNISELELTEQQLDEAIVSQYAKESEEALLEQQIQQAILLQSQKEYFEQLHKQYNL
jgi:gamma-glutamyl phosphate reductase